MSDPSASALQAQELGVKKEENETISASLLPVSHLSPADTATAASTTTTTTNNNAMKTTTTNAPDDLSKPPPLVTGFSSSAATPARETNPPIVIRSVTPVLSNASGPPPAKTAAALAVTTAATTTPALTISAAPTTTTNAVIIPPKQRLYRSAETHGNKNKWVTREIAALGFLLGIPLEAEASIVKQGWLLQQEQLREKNNKDFSHTINSSSIMDESGRGADSDSNYAAAGTAATAAAAKGHWWEKHLQGEDVQAAAAALAAASPRGGGVGVDTRPKGGTTYETELERPPSARASTAATQTAATAFNYAPPGRRLEGDEAVRVQIPLMTRTLTKQRYIARQAALRQWELQTAHGLTTTTTTTATMGEKTSQNNNNHSNTAAGGANISKSVPSTPGTTTTSSSISLTSVAATSAAATAATTTTTTGTTTSTTTTRTIPPLLDGRLFFSAGGSYPVSVFSVIRYEPRKEELLRRRQKLEAMGGGGSQFVMPTRDWRGISYRSLLPRLDNNSSSKKKTHHHRHDRHHHHHGRHRRPKNFNRFLRSSQNEDDDDPIVALGDDGVNASRHSKHSNRSDENDNDSSTAGSDSSSLSDDSDDDVVYAPGILDDPNMVLGRHRTVMIGDRVTGPMVSSTIQFVKPALLKAELNKQFRERFDGWEPPRAARKYIGARVVDGAYKLMDPKEQTDDYQHDTTTGSALAMDDNLSSRNRQGETPNGGGTTAAASSAPPLSKEKQLRMPPSLTLSKIRSLKRQALAACVQARLEIGTVALACVYFERLCLDCRVDKSNRRLSFAACLLLAAKLNEPNIGLVMKNTADGGAATANSNNNNNGSNDNMSTRLQSLIRPNRRSSIMFASLLEFFTEDWNLALPVLFSAEWGVFAALGFSLHAKPSQVSFHFKRLMKTLEWNPRHYLGSTMFSQWQDALDFEEERNKRRERRKEKKQRRKEEQLLNLHLELVSLKTGEDDDSDGEEPSSQRPKPPTAVTTSTKSTATAAAGSIAANSRQERNSARIMGSGMRLLNRFGMRRIVSQDKLDQQQISAASQQLTGSMMTTLSSADQIRRGSTHQQMTGSALTTSPSMPSFGSAAVVVAAAAPALPREMVVDGTGIVAIDIPATEVDADASSIGSIANSDKGIII